MHNETISQYNITGTKIIQELLTYAQSFEVSSSTNASPDAEEAVIGDSDEEESANHESLLTRIDQALKEQLNQDQEQQLVKDIERMLKMFYLE
jgi:hypothetical protein